MDTDNLYSAVQKLEAETIAKRNEGLEELKRVLNRSKSIPKLKAMKDEGWHKVLELLFDLIKSDKSKYSHGSDRAKKTAEDRLERASSALRIVVEHCYLLLKHKTVYAVLDHIVDVLGFDGALFSPVRNEYLRTFRIILSNGSHGEHLRPQQWRTYTDFLLNSLRAHLTRSDSQSNTNGSSSHVVSFWTSQTSNAKSSHTQSATWLDDLLITLKSLSAITNGPLLTRSHQIVDAIILLLSSNTRQIDVALETLNNILLLTSSEDVKLTVSIVEQLAIILRRSWSDPKATSRQRDQILTTMFTARHFIFAGVERQPRVRVEIVNMLADTFLSEYQYRKEDELLQLSDLVLSYDTKRNFFCTSGIGLDMTSPNSIVRWTTVAITAMLHANKRNEQETRDSTPDSPRPAVKRQKLRSPLLSFLSSSAVGKKASYPARLQIALFMVDYIDIDLPLLNDCLDEILTSITEDRRTRPSWALLILARLSTTPQAMHVDLQSKWSQVWTVASHFLSSLAHSRAACFTMMMLIEHDLVSQLGPIVNLSDLCFQGNSKGPPSITDASILLYTSCARSRFLSTEKQFDEFSSKVLSWLDLVWTLPTNQEQALMHIDQVARMVQPVPVHNLYAALTGGRFITSHQQKSICVTGITRAFVHDLDEGAFSAFLLNVDESNSAQGVQQTKSSISTSSSHLHRQSGMVLVNLIERTRKFGDAYLAISSDRSLSDLSSHERAASDRTVGERHSRVSIEVAEILMTVCAVAYKMAMIDSYWKNSDEIMNTWQCVLDFVSDQHHNNLPEFEISTLRITGRLFDIDINDHKDGEDSQEQRNFLMKSINDIVSQSHVSETNGDEMDDEFQESRQSLQSQQIHSKSQRNDTEVSRRDMSIGEDDSANFAVEKLLLAWQSCNTHPSDTANVPAKVEYVLRLGNSDFLSARYVLIDFIENNPMLTIHDIARLLRRTAEVCLEPDDHERNEVALCFCLKMMQITAYAWTITEDEELNNVALEIYSWFIDVALGKGIASIKVLFNIALLLESLLRHQPRYGTSGEIALPSPRTSLLQILKSGPSIVRYMVVPGLIALFEGYVLTEHAAIFDDIVDCLPTDPDNEEGIAARLYILAKLGSRWKTVLRQAVYHIFETIANVPIALSTAQRSLEMMASDVKLTSSKHMFHLFCPQILFTWLETGEIETVPFAAFHYRSLRDIVSSEQEEFVAQAALRRNPKHVHLLETVLAKPWADLLKDNFARCHVYAIINDVSIQRVGSETGHCEAALQKWLGDEDYNICARQSFPEAIALAIVSLSDDKGLEKILTASNEYKSLLETLDYMRQKSHSTVQYPSRQQPTFRAKYLMQILYKICQNAGTDLFSCWTPALTAFVYRRILDDAHVALGPLHVASMIRKIRVTVALAGSVALRGYPLEMLLQNLRPYLTNFHCAEDTIGIYWYLLEHGQNRLEQMLPFVTGLGVSIFCALSHFATSLQESTTQESQFQSTMSKAKDFQLWLSKYFMKFDISGLANGQAERFHQIISNAKDITSSGSNCLDHEEGMLLHHILLDQALTKPLISHRFFPIIIQALDSDFRLDPCISNDALKSEEDLVEAAPVLLKILQKGKSSKAFLTWAGSALGRAYTVEGPALSIATSPDRDRSMSEDSVSVDTTSSYAKVLQVLVDMLWSESDQTASTSEWTLSFILSSLSKADRSAITSTLPERAQLEDLVFDSLSCPRPRIASLSAYEPVSMREYSAYKSMPHWASSLAENILAPHLSNQFFAGLLPILGAEHYFAEHSLPLLVHLVLETEAEDHQQQARELLSKSFNELFKSPMQSNQDHIRLALDIITYLRHCVYPKETTLAKRNSWLDIHHSKAAMAALSCNLPHTALLMLEIERSETILLTSRARRSSVKPVDDDTELLAKIFAQVDDPDFFYGSYEELGISSVLSKLQHENQGSKVLAMQSALFDARTKIGHLEIDTSNLHSGITSALSLANLNGLACITQQHMVTESTLQTKGLLSESFISVNQWDIPNSAQTFGITSPAAVFRAIETVQKSQAVETTLHDHLFKATEWFIGQSAGQTNPASKLDQLAILSDIQQITTSSTFEDLNHAWRTVSAKRKWATRESFDSISSLLVGREAIFSAMRNNEKSGDVFRTTRAEALLLEIKTVRKSLEIGRIHDASQFCLNRAMYLSELQQVADEFKLNTRDVMTYDVANILWSQGEVQAPIAMLKSLQDSKTSPDSEINISKAEILTDLGQKLSQARLDRPDEVTALYLKPAIKALGEGATGSMAGRVYHNFAAFCDEQLQDSAGKDDFERIEQMRNRKLSEVHDLAEMCKKAEGKTRESLKQHYAKARTWFKLDEEEYNRLRTNREQLLRSSLENYLLALQACDDYNKDVIRLLSLWLSNTKSTEANSSVQAYITGVPTIKFAPYVNQLSSRLLNSGDRFQHVLVELMFRICCDHPFHSLYQLFAVWKTKGAAADEVAASRHKAAERLATTIQSPKGGATSQIWIYVHNSNVNFVHFATEKQEKEMKIGSKIAIRKFKYGQRLEQTIQGLSAKIPPPTMKVSLRSDKDYSSLPTLSSFEPNISVAGGVSAPKIVTAIASDGSRHKMLLKGGNDDLRQDAIMEQVFGQVSDLLDDHRPTRQRNLGIRTYKVIPLTQNAGIIEFVQNTVPLHDYLLPAHTRYFPKDLKPNVCRKMISDAQAKKADERSKVYRNVVSNFHPVMRFFFMEHFLEPNEWFYKRLNYSRSTAAISILGHVLGLGDRHGHNILLDEQTGEVVHIDLGVAFEAGRVLPVPEVVPFRLTRDLVDGLGVSGVEGPFRRCCNFTLEALRKNQDAIMTILDVLRWDPLYSWSISPLRLQRMQDDQEREAAAAAEAAGKEGTPGIDETDIKGKKAAEQAGEKKKVKDVTEQAGEADRALAVVAKKLSASLSVEATVNELIRQATDERNLSVLYCGWGAYA